MPSIRDYIDPGGRMLARRLEQFCAVLEDLGTRLRGTIANAIGETIGFIVRDTALRVLGEVAHYFPASRPLAATLRPNDGQSQYRDHYDDERGYWDDDDEVRLENQSDERVAPTTVERVPAALSAGLQAAAWWLRRWSGRKRALTTLAVGLVATGVAFLGGPLVIAVLGLAQSAAHFHALSDAMSPSATPSASVHSPS
jgi:hypothetical protein